MSRETMEWLNQNTLIGFTSKRGNAWHYRASDQGDEPNHYENAIPVDDVRRRLFSWKAVARPMTCEPATLGLPFSTRIDIPNKVAILRNDNNHVLGVMSEKYALHQYDEALLAMVEDLLDDDLQIGSAGLLKGGKIAWVQIEMPDNFNVADVEFRPNLLATTSFNGSIATTYKRTVTVVVCDNTRQMALQEDSENYVVRHTAHSRMRLDDARKALKVIHDLGEDFTREITELLDTTVTDKQFDKFLESLVPIKDANNESAASRARNERDAYRQLWREDERVAPWRGNAFGALQAVNTYRQHVKPTRGDTLRLERTMMETLTGSEGEDDRVALKKLMSIVA